MKHPLWKRWLSYFKEVTLEETGSEYNEVLEVLLVQGRHQLATEDAIYSYDDKYVNFDHVFGLMDWDRLSGDQVLNLGLGLWSTILLMEQKYGRRLQHRAVEIDPEICRLCAKYTLTHLDSPVEILNTEALSFLEMDANSYDLILMDIFESGIIPSQFQTEDFVRMLKNKLQIGGFLIYNRLNITERDKEENVQFIDLFKKHFASARAIPVRENIVIVSDGRLLN